MHIGQKARLISSTYIPKPEGICLNWWYHMNSKVGEDIGRINVFTLGSPTLWSISNNQGDYWRTASLTIRNNENFQVI